MNTQELRHVVRINDGLETLNLSRPVKVIFKDISRKPMVGLYGGHFTVDGGWEYLELVGHDQPIPYSDIDYVRQRQLFSFKRSLALLPWLAAAYLVCLHLAPDTPVVEAATVALSWAVTIFAVAFAATLGWKLWQRG